MKFQATRESVVKTCIELADRGYLAATGGNVALRADQDHFAITPSARPDCGACIHTHQPIASAYTLLAKPLEVRDRACEALLGRSIPCVGYAPSGTVLLARRVARAARPDTHAYLMRNHGAVCIGKDVTEAMTRVAALESECASFFLMRTTARSGELDQSVRALVIQTLRPLLGDALTRFDDVITSESKKAS